MKFTYHVKPNTEQPQQREPNRNVPCLVWRNNEVSMLWWDAHYLSFNDSADDDHECDLSDVDFWCEIPEFNY